MSNPPHAGPATESEFPSSDELEACLPRIRAAPADQGTLRLIVRRPGVDLRESVESGRLDPAVGLVGDTWAERPSSRTPNGTPHPDMQVTMMNVRVLEAICRDPERRPLAGDQLYVDLDIGHANLPAGTRLAIGTALIEVTEQPHRGCGKFRSRFGAAALSFVNSAEGDELRLRGLNARVVRGGTVTRGDTVRKVL